MFFIPKLNIFRNSSPKQRKHPMMGFLTPAFMPLGSSYTLAGKMPALQKPIRSLEYYIYQRSCTRSGG